jgi:hypothetical protein
MSERMANRIGDGLTLADREVVEVPLLLPSWQVTALATAAQDRGLTAGEMLRHLLHDFIQGLEERRSRPAR